MDGKTFLCAMAVYDGPTQARIDALRARLTGAGFIGSQTKDLPHHITLGIFQPEEQETAAGAFEEARRQAGALPVMFNHIGVFGGSKVLFLAPDASQALLDLKGYFGPCWGWTPHTTLLIDDPSRVYTALPLAMEGFEAFGGRVTGLQLYQFCPRKLLGSCGLAGQ